MGGIVQPVISDQKPPLDAYRLNIIIEAESKNKGGGMIVQRCQICFQMNFRWLIIQMKLMQWQIGTGDYKMPERWHSRS